jgi:hypothetical protein
VTKRRLRPERSRKLRAAQLVTTAALMVLAVVVLGCGGNDDETNGDGDGGEAFAPHIVTDSDIDAQEDGSPERALLEWWQAYQFGDQGQVEARTSTETLDEVGKGNLAELVELQGQSLQGVEVLSATESGDTANVRVGLLTFTPEKEGDPPPTTPTQSTPETFAMTNEDGEWRFAETEFLVTLVENLKQSQEEAAEEEE